MMANPSPIEVDERNGGCGVIFKDRLYVWGGNGLDRWRPYDVEPVYISDSDESKVEEESEEVEEEEIDPNLVIETPVILPRPSDSDQPFDVFDLSSRTWSRQPTTGKSPSLGLGSSLNFHLPSRSIYLFSGWNDRHFDSGVYKISTDTWHWEVLQPLTAVKPSPRYLTGVFIHEDRMCMFGGVGPDIKKDQDPGASYRAYSEWGMRYEFGWNNEYYEFDLKSSTWTAPLGEEALRPDPMGSMSFSKCDQHRAILFGGKCHRGRMNELYVFDLDMRMFTGPVTPSGPDQPWPIGRRFATLTPLVDPEMVGQRLCGCGPVLRQSMLLLWGKHDNYAICNETWILDPQSCEWVQLNIDLKPRSWHIACPRYSRVSTECLVVIFGGNVHVEGTFGDRVNTADLRILPFGVKSLVDSCLNAIVKSEELMAKLSSLSPALHWQAAQIKTVYEAHNNSPPPPHITFALQNYNC